MSDVIFAEVDTVAVGKRTPRQADDNGVDAALLDQLLGAGPFERAAAPDQAGHPN